MTAQSWRVALWAVVSHMFVHRNRSSAHFRNTREMGSVSSLKTIAFRLFQTFQRAQMMTDVRTLQIREPSQRSLTLWHEETSEWTEGMACQNCWIEGAVEKHMLSSFSRNAERASIRGCNTSPETFCQFFLREPSCLNWALIIKNTHTDICGMFAITGALQIRLCGKGWPKL